MKRMAKRKNTHASNSFTDLGRGSKSPGTKAPKSRKKKIKAKAKDVDELLV